MLIISQLKNKTTQSLEFSIVARETCKNEVIPKDIMGKFNKITQRRDSSNITLKELKGIGELMGKDMTRTVYEIINVESNRCFGTYTTLEKSKKALAELIQAVGEQKNAYQMPKDKELGLTLF